MEDQVLVLKKRTVCSTCYGLGYVKPENHVLPNAYVPHAETPICDECSGRGTVPLMVLPVKEREEVVQ